MSIPIISHAPGCLMALLVGFLGQPSHGQVGSGGIRPLDAERMQSAIQDGESGAVPPSDPLSLRLETIQLGKAAEDARGPKDEVALRAIQVQAPFVVRVLSPYVRVAVAAAEAKRTGQPRPNPPLPPAHRQVVTVRVSPGTASATADAIAQLTIDTATSSWHPLDSRVKPSTVPGRGTVPSALTEGEFDFPLDAFAPQEPITLVLKGRRDEFRWTITRSELARLQ